MQEAKNINFVYGLNNALSVIQSNKYAIDSIKIMRNSIAHDNSQLKNNLNDFKTIIEYLDKKDFISQFNYKHTQGIIVFFSGNLLSDFDNIDLNEEKEDICYVIIDQINDPQNLGQIIRTCECAGVDKIILTYNRSVKLYNASLQVSQGAFTNISFYICTNLRATLDLIKKYNYWLIALENGINANEWHKVDLKGKVGIILGSEGRGIRRLTLENSDFKATIPMQGEINSLNVSAACSAILFERLRQVLNSK